ncbi:MAG: hypothetical protein A2381_03230 [Bdellovibrionales bacterium RIFOXYB1_FULL_37_110]|nr:MAG: hypothetical protein A2417_03720 [Bdellovibrionales bacterium RIFOXYC1_FULL_37_79]OFZ57939.1 MAG: hypothetical protein A2381_03230 [Bdellovibrionales bacterium RIFOXYB1_FULL_37_110]OFZ63076.1 MAG: hypothetical protein A2577_15360 [Bdellovibrionales bacterium RIFOXYD1_FULL_36_51]
MIEIFAYDDYRKFLQDYFSFKKNKDSKYSLTYYSRLIDSSDSYIKQVLAKRRRLNLEKAKVLTEKLHLSTLESSFFLTLVMKHNAKTKGLRLFFDNLLISFRELGKFEYSDDKTKRNVFDNSLLWELYTYMGSDSSNQDEVSIANALTNQKATPDRIESAINFLIKMNALEIENGKYKTKNIVLEHSQNIRDIYVVALERAIEYLQSSKEEEAEYFDSFCIVTDDDKFQQIKNLLQETKNKMATILKNPGNKNRICYYNTNLFYVSKRSDEK